jgi:hypothetical protein
MLHPKIEFKISTAVPTGKANMVSKRAGGTQKGTQSEFTDQGDTTRHASASLMAALAGPGRER